MTRIITIDPVTRIEGHAKITIQLDDTGAVSTVRFHVKEFRGFEKFCEGALAERLPFLTSRICGICPVSHHIASTKAVENCFGTEISSTAEKLREALLLGQLIESHMLSLILLSFPDFYENNHTPSMRNIVDIYQKDPGLVRRALDFRSAGTEVIHIIGRRAGHPIGATIGGMIAPLTEEERLSLLHALKGAEVHIQWLSDLMRSLFEKNDKAIHDLGDIQSSYMGLSGNDGLAFYHGVLNVMREDGSQALSFNPHEYFDHVKETHEPWSYMKFPVLTSGGGFRVGPLARVNIANSISTPLANAELTWFREHWSRPAHKTLTYHYARFIETIYAIERLKELLNDPEITSKDIYNRPEITGGVGIGVVEAPRGTLVHRYEFDEEGKAIKVTFVVSTQHNNYGFNEALTQTATKLISPDNLKEEDLNKLEMIVRAYDPCISCSTHGLSNHRFLIELTDHEGTLLKEWR